MTTHGCDGVNKSTRWSTHTSWRDGISNSGVLMSSWSRDLERLWRIPPDFERDAYNICLDFERGVFNIGHDFWTSYVQYRRGFEWNVFNIARFRMRALIVARDLFKFKIAKRSRAIPRDFERDAYNIALDSERDISTICHDFWTSYVQYRRGFEWNLFNIARFRMRALIVARDLFKFRWVKSSPFWWRLMDVMG